VLRSVVLIGLLAWSAWSAAAAEPEVFRWVGDSEGGAPYVQADPSAPDTLVGVDVEIAQLIARHLGRPPQFVNVSFALIDLSDASPPVHAHRDGPLLRVS
jgi:polar amino acid transport system substrate-binding protein